MSIRLVCHLGIPDSARVAVRRTLGKAIGTIGTRSSVVTVDTVVAMTSVGPVPGVGSTATVGGVVGQGRVRTGHGQLFGVGNVLLAAEGGGGLAAGPVVVGRAAADGEHPEEAGGEGERGGDPYGG